MQTIQTGMDIVKIVMLGEGSNSHFLPYIIFKKITGRVGKTSLTLRYVRNTFDDNQESTINASYVEKKVEIDSKTSLNLAIWVHI